MATAALPPRVVRFGAFRLDFATAELRKHNVPLKLRPQVAKALLLLATRPGETITREQLRQEIWGNGVFLDFEHSLNVCMREIRAALDDDADKPRYIETVPRRGYRFIARVEEVAATGPSPQNNAPSALSSSEADQHASITKAPRSQRWSWMAGGFVLAAVALAWLGAARVRERLPRTSEPPRIRSLAVLPLENLSRDPDQEYFADGMTDELITDLSKMGGLRVISRTSSMRYKGINKSLPEIAKELNVDGVIEGSVSRSGTRVRITAQLLDAHTDQHLWAETYERDLGDVLKLQSEVAEAIARQVRIQLTPQERARLTSPRAFNPEAYEAYVKGHFEHKVTPQEIQRAQAYFEDALRKDPGFAPAYVGLAECYMYLGDYRRLPPQDADRQAKEALRKALALDQTLADAHRALAWLSWRHDWDWAAAEREFRYSLQLNPNYAAGHGAFALYLGWSGRRAEALAEVERVRELDPGLFVWTSTTAIYYHLRDYPSMIEASRKSLESDLGRWTFHYYLAVGYEGSGKPLEAIAEYQKAVELSQGDQDPTAGLAHAYVSIGKSAEAEKILHELERQSRTSYVSPYMIATIYAGLGDKDRAFHFLERAYEERSSDLPYFLKADLRLDTLRSDPRFLDLLRRIGLSP